MEQLQRKRKVRNSLEETEEHKRARLDERNRKDRERRAAETAEEKRKRLEKRRERERAKRRVESTSDKEKRLEKRKNTLATETPVKRAKRYKHNDRYFIIYWVCGQIGAHERQQPRTSGSRATRGKGSPAGSPEAEPA